MKKFAIKKCAALVTAVALLVSVFACFGSVSASAATAFVTLDHSETYDYDTNGRYIYIKTDGSTADQQVYVHYEKTEGQAWVDEQADFYKTLSDGSKIWKADITSDEDCTEYVLKYVANGVTYWDNNNGQNYSGHNNLGCNAVEAVRVQHYSYYFTSYVAAKVKNLGYNKHVFIRVSFNNWKTYTDYDMTYSATEADGNELWTTSFTRPIQNEGMQYAVCYEVNGQTYWANNFGENYSWDFHANYF